VCVCVCVCVCECEVTELLRIATLVLNSKKVMQIGN
jgi:hypothetical protein